MITRVFRKCHAKTFVVQEKQVTFFAPALFHSFHDQKRFCDGSGKSEPLNFELEDLADFGWISNDEVPPLSRDKK